MKLAVLCYVQKDSKTLMLEVNNPNSPVNGYWNGVGGKLYPGESPEDCVMREVKEETGLTPTQIIYAGLLIFPNNGRKREPWYVFVYVVSKFIGELMENSAEGRLEWIPTDDVINININEGDKIFLPWVFEGKIFSAKFEHENEVLESYEVEFY